MTVVNEILVEILWVRIPVRTEATAMELPATQLRGRRAPPPKDCVLPTSSRGLHRRTELSRRVRENNLPPLAYRRDVAAASFHPSCFERDRTPRPDNARPTTCTCLDPSSSEVLVGSADHAAYVFDADTAAGRRRLYSRSCGHVDWVSCCAYLPDGRPVTGGMDGKLCLWERGRGSRSSCVRCTDLIGEQGSVSAVIAVGKEGAGGRIISSGYDGSLCIWNINSSRGVSHAKLTNPTKALPPINAFAYSISDGSAMSCSRNGMVSLWDCGVGMRIVKAVFGKHSARVSSVLALGRSKHESHADTAGVFFATGGMDGHVALWDPRSAGARSKRAHPSGAVTSTVPQKRSRLSEECAPITALVESPSSTCSTGCAPVPHLVSGGGNGTLMVLEPRKNLEPIAELLWGDADRGRRAPVTALCTKGTGSNAFIFSGSADGHILAHKPHHDRPVYTIEAKPGSTNFLAATNSSLVSSGDDGSAYVYKQP